MMEGKDRPVMWRGRGRASPVGSLRASRSPSLSSRTTDTSEDTASHVTSAVAGLSLDTGEAVPGPRTRSPVNTARGTRRGVMLPVVTRPSSLASKKGTSGRTLDLIVNYFLVKKAPHWCLYQYRVDFTPDTDFVQAKKAHLRQHEASLGMYIFDGGNLMYTSNPLASDTMAFQSQDKIDPTKTCTITVRQVGSVAPGDIMYITFYNNLVKRCLSWMKLKPMGRGHFNIADPINVPEYKLSLYPGFITSIRQHENDVLLCVENAHKVVRQDSVLDILQALKDKPGDYVQVTTDEIVGTVVLTHYNHKTYSVTDIAWDLTPKNTFECRGQKVSYAQYFNDRYGLKVTVMDQPLLVAKPKEKDFHRRGKDEPLQPQVTHLIPELCQMTGLPDAMRANNSLMRELAKHLHMGPPGRIHEITNFMKTLQSSEETATFMKNWNLEFSPKLVQCTGRTLPSEKILFNGGEDFPAGDKADWTMAFRSKKLFMPATLKQWSIIVPEREEPNVHNLVSTMMKVARPLGFNIPQPKQIFKTRPGIGNYTRAIDALCDGNNDLLFVILPNNKLDLYAAVKKRLSAEVGLISQCFLAKNVTSKGLMSIATKVVIQICAKLGGEPWTVQIPLKKMMVVGFDVCRGTKATQHKNVAAMTASYSQTYASYYSTVSFYTSSDELSRSITTDLMKCLDVYKEMSNEYPERILFFRDGVGDGQLEQVITVELKQMQTALEEKYKSGNLSPPKFTFVVVSKKINTRLFSSAGREPGNPPPGTICDDVVTLPERYDFFLIPQTARQGAVSPSGYNVIFDGQNLSPDRIQRLTFKFCHLYFNWSGTVAVPAPCQYAHKLAALTGQAIGKEPSNNLAYNLHFL